MTKSAIFPKLIFTPLRFTEFSAMKNYLSRGEKRGNSGRKERKTTCCMMERLNLDDDDDEFGDELGECHYLVPKGVRRDDRSRQHI